MVEHKRVPGGIVSFKEKMRAAATPPLMMGFNPEARHTEVPPSDRAQYQRLIFQDMLNRTANSFHLHRFSPQEERTPAPSRLRIASVRSKLDIKSKRQVALSEFRDGTQLLRANDGYLREEWTQHRLDELNAALDLKPDIICFPEFSFPPPPPPLREGGWAMRDINRSVAHRVRFEEEAEKVLKQRRSKAFVFLGSYHCLMTLYNVGVIYPWGADRKGRVSFTEKTVSEWDEGELERSTKYVDRDVEAPIFYQKRYPARKVGERTRVPTGWDFNIFTRSFGQLGVAICSDIVDLNQFGMFIREGFDPHKGYDIILIPAYNAGSSFGPICRDLSYMSATAVVVVNARDPWKQELPASEIYVCGEPARRLDTSTNRDLRKLVSFDDRVLANGSTIELCTMNLKRFKNARRMHLNKLRSGQPSPDLYALKIGGNGVANKGP